MNKTSKITDPEVREDIAEMINYLWPDELNNFLEYPMEDHIFLRLLGLSAALYGNVEIEADLADAMSEVGREKQVKKIKGGKLIYQLT